MAMKITINGNEVKNPLARLVFALLGGIVLFIAIAFMLFILLPLIWFAVLSVLILLIGLLSIIPRLIHKVHIIQQDKNRLS